VSHFPIRPLALAAFCVSLAAPAAAQPKTGLMADLVKDITDTQAKIVGLANAMPETAFDWRPGDGVRSTKEVFVHLTGDNYFLPALAGIATPAETGILGTDYKTAEAFEKRTRTRAQVIAELEQSFAFLKQSMGAQADADLDAQAKNAQRMTARQLWLATATHLHEHLGQLIAYARSNKVTPPWSK